MGIENGYHNFFVFLNYDSYRIKKCADQIWYVNDNLIYAHLHRLSQVGFATFFLLVLNLRGVNDVSVHKLNYH